MSKNIILIGFMASGKSIVSNHLCRYYDRIVYSTDQMIERREGQSITQIFEERGETVFRKIESEIVEQLADMENIIVDCGGGVVLNPENMKKLKKNGFVVYLKSSAEVIYERVKGKNNRPLLNVKDPLKKIQEMLKERESYYSMADMTIDSNHSNLDLLCEEIVKGMKND